MKLPFLKNKRLPRIATEGPEDKLINASADDHIQAHCASELMEACSSKDVKKFRSAIQALVMNMFDWENEDGE